MRLQFAISSLVVLAAAQFIAPKCSAQCVDTEQQEFAAADGKADDGFGVAVDLDGSRALIGAFLHEHSGAARNSGAAYVYEWSAGAWNFMAELRASDAEQGDRLGYSAAVEGSFAAVAAPFADSTVNPANTDSGAVYVYRLAGGMWSEFQILAAPDDNLEQRFGHDVDLANGVLLIGAPGDDDGGTESGSAYVYLFNGSQWVLDQELYASDPTVSKEFGYSVATDGVRCLCGAPEDGAMLSGAAYVFANQAGNWTLEQKLIPMRAGNNDFYGDTVDVDGTRIVVGSIDESAGAGAIAVFERTGNPWQETAELKPSDSKAGAEFASRIELDSDCVLAGAFFADAPNSASSGAAYLFRFGGTVWVEQVKWVASDSAAGDTFGIVALDDDRALVGAVAANSGIGSVYAYTRDEVTLVANQAVYFPGDPAKFTTCGCVPNTLVLLYSVSPLVFRIAKGLADSAGRFPYSATVPPGLAGLTVDLLSFGFPASGMLGASNVRTITFQ